MGYLLDNAGRVSNVYLNRDQNLSHGYDLAGTAQDNTWTYGRNEAQEINSHAWSNNAYQWTGHANGTKAYTPNGLNQYTAAAGATLGYDGSGNLTSDGTWTYGYDAGNRLRRANKAGLAASLTYDGLDRMRRTTIAGVTTSLLYHGTGPVAEYDGSNSLLRRYVHGPGIDEPLVWYEGSGTTNKTWLYADHQNSIAAAANSAGTSTATYAYGPYGEPDVTSGIRFRYTGQQLLGQLGLYHYKARFYSSALGRFLQTDPIGYESDLNLYAYVGNDPVNLTDPTGTIGINLGAAGIGAFIGGVSAGITAYANGVGPIGIAASTFIGAAGGAVAGFALAPLGSIVVSGITGGAGNLLGQTVSSDKSINLGDAGVATLTGAAGGGASVLAKAGGFGATLQAGFGGSATAVSQGLVDLRTAANRDFTVTGTPSNSPANILANSFGNTPTNGIGAPASGVSRSK